MSLRTKIVLLNAAALAIALLAGVVAVGGVWAALGPFHRVVEEEARAVEVAEQQGLSAAQTEAIEQALSESRSAERGAAATALFATALPVVVLAAGGIACAALSLRFSGSLLVRLGTLGRATAAVAGGDRGVRVTSQTARRGDELDAILVSFDRMVVQLDEAEGRAREADVAKSRFFSGVSHDLRTPLTTIMGLLESLRREEWDDATRDEFLEVAHREAERLTRLVTDVLDLGRLEANAWALERERVDVAALARSVVADLSLPKGALAGRVVRVVTDGEAIAWGDEMQLRRVLQNLLSNAAKFSPASAPMDVEVRGWDREGTVRVAVRDRGQGVSPAEEELVFDRYYRAGSARGVGAGGAGLGLAIAKGMVEGHGGRIWVEHPNGGGARFVFEVPAAAESTAAEMATGVVA